MDQITSSKTSPSKQLQIVGTTLLLVIFFLASQIGNSDARTLSTDDDFFSAPLIKRNTWWTKKSVDSMDTIPQTNYPPEDSQYGKCQDAIEVYSCYVERCVQSFVTCARQAETEELFSACKMLHKMCASICSNGNQNDFIRL
ncbi:uncharacterized protein LOC132716712 [Ruditapes philippinarum]|uniref:uncharacterized protein LOC132716712 n=1 Tax=Ruditapes philippinarum TaxID=129788 RepID=UPI00295A6D2B|nr:uncharacterized protein LOC132716712 [Ruditapes philippinarum]